MLAKDMSKFYPDSFIKALILNLLSPADCYQFFVASFISASNEV